MNGRYDGCSVVLAPLLGALAWWLLLVLSR